MLETYAVMVEPIKAALTDAGFAVVAVATDPGAALELIETHKPALVLVGVDRGFEHTEFFAKVRASCPDASCVVSGPAGTDSLEEALRADIDAYVLKSAPVDDLVTALRQLSKRTIYFKTRVAAVSELTPREIDMLRLAAAGLQNSQIATELGVTVQTVKFHLTNIYKKLDLANRAEATRWAVKNGLV